MSFDGAQFTDQSGTEARPQPIAATPRVGIPPAPVDAQQVVAHLSISYKK